MTAQPQNRPLPPPMLQPPLAPPLATSPLAPPLAFHPPQGVTRPPAERTGGPARLSRIVLVASALVAVAGVSFSLGRLSVEEALSDGSAASFAAGALRPGADANAALATEARADAAATVGLAAPVPAAGEAAAGGDEAAVSAATATDDAEAVAVTSLEADTLAGDDLPRPVGAPDGPPGGGAGRGGLSGTVAELTDSTLVVTLADGSTLSVAVDASTAWVEQASITAADVSVGDTVSVQLPFGAFGPDADTSTSSATQVTVTTPGP